jgi:hypothetical protein
MPIIGKSAALGAAFLAGIVIAADADPPYRAGTDSSQPARPQTATLPPAYPARAPGRVTPQFDPLGPTPRQSFFGRDGAYAGWMTEQANGQFRDNRGCVSRRPVSMKVEGGNVTIWYTNWEGQTMHYRGKLDPTGKIDAWHTNGDGSRRLIAGQIGDTGFTGHVMAGDLCSYDVTMRTAEATAGSPAR